MKMMLSWEKRGHPKAQNRQQQGIGEEPVAAPVNDPKNIRKKHQKNRGADIAERKENIHEGIVGKQVQPRGYRRGHQIHPEQTVPPRRLKKVSQHIAPDLVAPLGIAAGQNTVLKVQPDPM